MDILPQLIVNGIIAGSVIALIAMGLSLIYGVLQFMNFAHGEMAMLGAFFYYFLYIHTGWPVLPSLVGAIVICIALGLLFNKIIFEPLRQESPWTLLITSIGVSIFIKSTMTFFATGKSRGYDYDATVYQWFNDSVRITDYQLWIIGATALTMVGMAAFLKYSKTGKSIRAVSDNAQIAAILGVDVKRTVTTIFAISTGLAAMAGILIGYEQNLTPNMGLWLSIMAFSAVIVGGLGNVWGAVLGAMIIGILQEVLVGIDLGPFSIPSSYKTAIAFSLVILMLLIRPRGLFGINTEEEARK
jgi:branched-subunit amino acid ABC-type transport system permease component